MQDHGFNSHMHEFICLNVDVRIGVSGQGCVLPDLNCSVWKDLSITVPVALGRHTATCSVLSADLTEESLASRSALSLSQVHFGITLLMSGGESELLDPVHLHKRVIKLFKEKVSQISLNTTVQKVFLREGENNTVIEQRQMKLTKRGISNVKKY